jgi:hypothetical protein
MSSYAHRFALLLIPLFAGGIIDDIAGQEHLTETGEVFVRFAVAFCIGAAWWWLLDVFRKSVQSEMLGYFEPTRHRDIKLNGAKGGDIVFVPMNDVARQWVTDLSENSTDQNKSKQ